MITKNLLDSNKYKESNVNNFLKKENTRQKY